MDNISNIQIIPTDKMDNRGNYSKSIVYSDPHDKVKRHRLDGPAYIALDSNGEVVGTCWYINGHNCNVEIRVWAKENNIDLDNLTDACKVFIAFAWADYDGDPEKI